MLIKVNKCNFLQKIYEIWLRGGFGRKIGTPGYTPLSVYTNGKQH